MSRWRILAGAGGALLLLSGITGTAYSLFRNPDVVEVSGDTTYETAVDDIEENWSLRDNNQQGQWYDLYFFVQQQAAELDGDPLDSYIPQESEYYGYWRSSDLEDGVQEQEGYPLYGWRKITVYRSVTAEQLESVGVGKSGRYNTSGGTDWYYNFSGWTADRATAAEMIDKQQGEYNYFSIQDNLAELDASTDDGSEAGDNTIYLYPIYTLGKDNTIQAEERQPVVMIQDRDKDSDTGDDNRFFSQTGTRVDSIYYYNNFTVTQEDIDNQQFYLQVSPMIAGDTWTWHGDYIWSDDTTDLFPSAGTYNIYVKLYIKALNRWDPGAEWAGASDEEFLAYYTEEMLSEWVESLDQVSVNSLLLKHDRQVGDNEDNYPQPMVAFVSVSRVFEPRFLGGSEGTFEYSTDRPLIFEYDGWFDNAAFSDTADSGELVRTYALERIYLDPDTTFDFAHEIDGGISSGTFRSSVFSLDVGDLDHDTNSFWHNNAIQAMTTEELQAISDSSDSWFSGSWSTIGYGSAGLRRAVAKYSDSDVDYDFAITGESGDYEDPHRDLLTVDTAGYYDIAVAITYDKDISDTGMDITNPVNFIKEIKVAIRRTTSSYFIRIYESDSFEYHSSSESAEDEGIFVTWDFTGSNIYGNQLLYCFEFDELGGTIGYGDAVFTDSSGMGAYSLDDIIAASPDSLYDHVTGQDLSLAINRNIALDRNYIFFLNR